MSLIDTTGLGGTAGSPTCAAGTGNGNDGGSSFPAKLHRMLTDMQDSDSRVVSWASHGRAFKVHDKKTFLAEIMPKYFYQLKYNSFQRQLNLYGFKKIQHQGKDKGSFYHENFLRGRPELTRTIIRTKGKGETGRPRASEKEPDFFAMPPMPTSTKTNTNSSTSCAYSPQNTKTSPFLKDTNFAQTQSIPIANVKAGVKRPAPGSRSWGCQTSLGITQTSMDIHNALIRQTMPKPQEESDRHFAGTEHSRPILNGFTASHQESRPSAASPRGTATNKSEDENVNAFSTMVLPFDWEPTPFQPGACLPITNQNSNTSTCKTHPTTENTKNQNLPSWQMQGMDMSAQSIVLSGRKPPPAKGEKQMVTMGPPVQTQANGVGNNLLLEPRQFSWQAQTTPNPRQPHAQETMARTNTQAPAQFPNSDSMSQHGLANSLVAGASNNPSIQEEKDDCTCLERLLFGSLDGGNVQKQCTHHHHQVM
ncbi:shock factor protein [Seminavis robusta]|uniref:Shock factor protein n=1 Tax=Seminavis robusta TaxID=568900 RepID=A0A9N8EIL3_9STRA|nr:shock factor protein [Seminavis robusta]|eukprot:Sro993_g228930.1 shock factor protein (478) ;mRNA; r:19861-21627